MIPTYFNGKSFWTLAFFQGRPAIFDGGYNPQYAEIQRRKRFFNDWQIHQFLAGEFVGQFESKRFSVTSGEFEWTFSVAFSCGNYCRTKGKEGGPHEGDTWCWVSGKDSVKLKLFDLAIELMEHDATLLVNHQMSSAISIFSM